MVDIVITVAVIVILAILIWWIIGQVSLPEPLMKIATIVFVVVVVLALLSVLTGHAPTFRIYR